MSTKPNHRGGEGRKQDHGWASRVLGAADELALPKFGLACPVKDVHRGTPLG